MDPSWHCALSVPVPPCTLGVFRSSQSFPIQLLPRLFLRCAFNTVVFLLCIAAFYWFRYGGTFWHDDKPEWDTIPSLVKKDIFFFAKATVDDLCRLGTGDEA